MKDISTVIGTCDSYSYIWKNFDILFKRYWKSDTPNYVVGETLPFPYEGYKNILPGQGKEWGERILTCLEQVKTPYVFFILEDYYLTEEINQSILQEHITLLEKYNADKIMLAEMHGAYSLNLLEDGLYSFNIYSNYLNSVQPAIWKTDYLKSVLREYYSPWQFELEGNTFTSSISPKILIKLRQEPIYFNYARVGGRVSEGWEEVFRKENLTN